MGSWETFVNASFYDFAWTEIFLFVAGAGKSVFWYVNLLISPDSGGTYRVV